MAQKMTPAQMERKRVDDFVNARLAEQRMSRMQQLQQPANPNANGMMNLLNILMQRSPLQRPMGNQ